MFRLRNNLHWCNCSGRAVFLDVEADRYFCLPKASNLAFLRYAFRGAERENDEQLKWLVSCGILIEISTDASVQQARLIDPPTCEFNAHPATRPNIVWFLEVLARETYAARQLRTKPLLRVLKSVANIRSKSPKAPAEIDRLLKAIASASRTAAYVLREHNRCLVRALAVHSICKRNGINSRLVFGVIAHPFSAHCWVQIGSVVLVGGYEHARLFTPILVIE